MIGKKVKNPKKSASKAERIRKLTEYIRQPERDNASEKCIYANALGFLTDEPHSQTAEMIALAEEAVRSKDPINHYVLSWQDGEQPMPEQIDEAVDILLKEFGLEGHQVIYALHADTDNIHCHIIINRVHPETLKCIEINNGFDIECIHHAIARIEHKQGWRRQKNGRYKVSADGGIELANNTAKPRQPGQRQRDKENRTGQKSAQRIGIEVAAAIIARAKSWEQLHKELAEKGMRYEKAGSGAKIYVGDIAIKASTVDRNATLSKLQKRLGEYQPSSLDDEIKADATDREAEPLKPGAPGWKEYTSRRTNYINNKQASKVTLDRRQADEWKQLMERQKARRTKIFGGSWKGKGAELNALRSLIAAEQAAEKAALRDRHKKERAQYRERYRAYPSYEEWLQIQGRPDLADQWRRRETESCSIHGDSTEPPTARDIRAFKAKIVGRDVQYKQPGALGVPFVAFVDHGKRIDVYDWKNKDTTLAALQLAAQKWGSFQVSGDDEYKYMCAKLAAQHGLKITNPELQAVIENERQKLRAERLNAMTADVAEQQTDDIDVAEIYNRHHADIVSRQRGGYVDLDAVDSLIAVRMRVTGHTIEEIEQAILQRAQHSRQGVQRDWANYAKRTTLYAFSADGDRQVEKLAKYREEWDRLEGHKSKKRPDENPTAGTAAPTEEEIKSQEDTQNTAQQKNTRRWTP